MNLDLLREISAWTGFAAFVLLAWRMVGDWRALSAFERCMGSVLLVYVFSSAFASNRSLNGGIKVDHPEVVWPVFISRVLVIVFCLIWPRLRRILRA